MKQLTPLFKKRVKPRRKRPELFAQIGHDVRREVKKCFLDPRSYVTNSGRVRLFGQDYRLLRFQAWQRAKGRCQCCGAEAIYLENYVGIPMQGELSHNEHGARKSDELSRVKWMRHECHMKQHNCNGKPCPRKDGAHV